MNVVVYIFNLIGVEAIFKRREHQKGMIRWAYKQHKQNKRWRQNVSRTVK